jgi:hypothetical protein
MAKAKKKASLIFEKNGIEKIFDFNPESLRNFFITLSLLLISLVIAIFGTIIFFQEKIRSSGSQQGQYVIDLEKRNQELTLEKESFQLEIKNFQERLSSEPIKGENLSYFAPIKGFKDLSGNSPLTINDIKVEFQEGKGSLRFNLSPVKGDKVSGHIIVLQATKSGTLIYPKVEKITEDFSLKFSFGETFQVSRFRPVIANFDTQIKDKEIFYKILVFARNGDLLAQRKLGPFNTESLTN